MPGIFGESTCPQEEDMKRNQIDTDLGAAIKEGIILNNMTQKQLAKALHISQQTLSCYIHNQRTPNIHDLVAISPDSESGYLCITWLKEGHTGSSGSYYIQKYNEAIQACRKAMQVL